MVAILPPLWRFRLFITEAIMSNDTIPAVLRFTKEVIENEFYVNDYIFTEYGDTCCLFCDATHKSNFDKHGAQDLEHDAACIVVLAAKELGITLKVKA